MGQYSTSYRDQALVLLRFTAINDFGQNVSGGDGVYYGSNQTTMSYRDKAFPDNRDRPRRSKSTGNGKVSLNFEGEGGLQNE